MIESRHIRKEYQAERVCVVTLLGIRYDFFKQQGVPRFFGFDGEFSV